MPIDNSKQQLSSRTTDRQLQAPGMAHGLAMQQHAGRVVVLQRGTGREAGREAVLAGNPENKRHSTSCRELTLQSSHLKLNSLFSQQPLVSHEPPESHLQRHLDCSGAIVCVKHSGSPAGPHPSQQLLRQLRV